MNRGAWQATVHGVEKSQITASCLNNKTGLTELTQWKDAFDIKKLHNQHTYNFVTCIFLNESNNYFSFPLYLYCLIENNKRALD